jgi:hypothetical protein
MTKFNSNILQFLFVIFLKDAAKADTINIIISGYNLRLIPGTWCDTNWRFLIVGLNSS